MRWNDLLAADRIVMLVDPGSTGQVLDAAARLLSEGSPATTQLIADALRQREQLGSTAIGHGVALPHARIAGLDKVTGLFLRQDKPMDFDAVDRQPVDLVFALFAPKDSGVDHLKALALVSRTLRDTDLRAKLRANSDPAALHAILTTGPGMQAA